MDDDVEIYVAILTMFGLIAALYSEMNDIILILAQGFLFLRSRTSTYRSIKGKITRQLDNMHYLINDNDVTCRDHIRMNSDCFNCLCYLLHNLGGLRPTRNVSISEQVAIFLTILSHHTKNRVVKQSFRRAGYTISKHFNNVLNTLLRLYMVLLITHVPVPEDSSDNRWRYFKGCIGALDGTYIPVKVPHSDIPRYRNRKKNVSVNVLACNQHEWTNALPNVARGRKRVVQNSRCVWTYVEEMELVNALKELVLKGNKCDNGFKTGYLLLLENMLANKFPGLNSTTYRIDALPEVWDAHLKVNSTARSLKNKTFPFYSDWCDIFGNDRATGNDSQYYSDTVNEMNTEAAKKRGSSCGGEHADDMQVQFMDTIGALCDKNNSKFVQIADTMGSIAERIGSEFEACKKRGLVFDQLGSFECLSVTARVEVAQYLCNNSKDMDLFFSLPDFAKLVLVKGIMKKMDFIE
ncbi:hypothetical protein ACS0TY_033265 [Phlomoides rotata]